MGALMTRKSKDSEKGLTMSPIFSDNMILQRGTSLTVWGLAVPGDKICVSFAGQVKTASAGKDSKWKLALDPLEVSAVPGTMSVHSAIQDQTMIFRNVLVGDVWLCSGQSNMQLSVAESMDSKTEITTANHPKIRLFTVPRNAQIRPKEFSDGAWSVCSPSSIGDFSAVGYFFGSEIHRMTGVPIGLINCSWNGTCAEAWTSGKSLMADPVFNRKFAEYEREIEDPAKAVQEYAARLDEWKARYDIRDESNDGLAKSWHRPATDDSKWKKMELPKSWQDSGHKFSGVLWFRRELMIPADWQGQDLELSLGAIDKSDITYFNGTRVGSMTMEESPDAWRTPRVYTVPGKTVKRGRNLIAVRVFSNIYEGGFIGSPDEMKLRPVSKAIVSEPISLNGNWKFAVEKKFGLVPPPPQQIWGEGNPNSPHILFDNMISPLLNYGIRGAIWYQGEANAGQAEEYRKLFPMMIQCWRKAWKLGDFPFYFVQLANFQSPKKYHIEHAWAELRNAQAMTLSLPQTGMAVAIDVGDPEDVHPKNKKIVGHRLSLHALANDYGFKNLIFSGPIYDNMEISAGKIRVYFRHTAAGLVAHGKEIHGFSLAGKDGKFVQALAEIETDGRSVVVSSPQVKNPVAVRYGWANSPDCNLYNSSNLPASPFRAMKKIKDADVSIKQKNGKKSCISQRNR